MPLAVREVSEAAGQPKVGLTRPNSVSYSNDYPQIRIGVCAMDRKAQSKPMREIINRMNAFDEFEILIFGDDTILNKEAEQWPECNCLMSWHSEGFPLHKAQAYAHLHRPYLINDVHMQDLLLDRRKVYKKLMENMIPVPHHIIVDRDGLGVGENPPGFVETEDYVEMNGKRIIKPFVEKPASGEDHNIWIYYSHQSGGGVKKLFRKVGDRSADYEPDHPGVVRKDSSYIYEEFLPTGGTDVKVYTVGPRYAHAEARKSPVVDGKVLRTSDGKEIRFPVLLSPQEKDIARMVSLAFKQKVCGLDLLRADSTKVFVCDVNGWSFVKSSKKYYDDAAGILRTTILSALAPHRLVIAPTRMLLSSYHQLETLDTDPTDSLNRDSSYSDLCPMDQETGLTDEARHNDERSSQEELRCVLAIIRHGDRTPKQKMKMKVSHPLILQMFEKYKNQKGNQATIKSPNEMQELLENALQILKEHNMLQRTTSEQGSASTRQRLSQLSLHTYASEDERELIEGLLVVRAVLEKGGGFSGINRKVQLKPLQWGHDNEGQPIVKEILLILKHGGTLTHSGRRQAADLGKVFRSVMYPRVGPQGGGLLRLHSTYRHDLKIYSSDEGRVQCSAAAFAKAFLDLEGSSLTPILVSLVKRDAYLLDAFGKGASEDIARAKEILYRKMTFDKLTQKFLCSSIRTATPQPSPCGSPRRNANSKLLPSSSNNNSEKGSEKGSAGDEEQSWNVDVPLCPQEPLKLLHRLVELMQQLIDTLQQRLQEHYSVEETEDEQEGECPKYSALTQEVDEWKLSMRYPCGGEEILLVLDRWRKLLRTFWKERKNQFDISKVPDVYDSAKYDLLHNSHLRLNLDELFKVAKSLADAVIPNEYGVTPKDKLTIGSKICASLLGKLTFDLESMREESFQTSQSCGDYDGMYDYCAPEAELEHMPSFLEGGSNGSFDSDPDGQFDSEPIHRLAPNYADDINSPLRHVRTRIYFTSESHIHSLLNVLRYCQIDQDDAENNNKNNSSKKNKSVGTKNIDDTSQGTKNIDDVSQRAGTGTESDSTHAPKIKKSVAIGPKIVDSKDASNTTTQTRNSSEIDNKNNDEEGIGLLSPEGRAILENVKEFDYLTQIVFRMYENKTVAVDDAERFRVEILFSPGTNYNPLEAVPIKRDHVLPPMPRKSLHKGKGVNMQLFKKLLDKFMVQWKSTGPVNNSMSPSLIASRHSSTNNMPINNF